MSRGINLIKGSNESGKSTFAHFVKAMFYGVNRNKAGKAFSDFERFKPWQNSEFSGKLDYIVEDKKYSVFRDFNRNNAKIFDEEGTDITATFSKDKSRGAEVGYEQFGVDEETFESTVFITQKGVQVDSNERNNTIQKITNIIQSGDESISYDKAKVKLDKILHDEVGTERTRNKPINVVLSEIDTVEKTKESLVSNKFKKEELNDRQKAITESLKDLDNSFNKVKKVFDVKDKYASLVSDREKEYDISIKVLEKEKEEKINRRKQAKTKMVTLATVILATVSLTLIALGLYQFSFISSALILVSYFSISKYFSGEVNLTPVQDIVVTKENLRRKEKRELELLQKEGISEKLISKPLGDVRKVLQELEEQRKEFLLEEHKIKIENDSISEHIDRLNDVEEQLYELYEKEEDIRQLEFEIKLAMSKLDEAYEEIKADIVPQIQEKIKNNIGFTTNGKYGNTIYNDRQGIMVENSMGEVVQVEKLSGGTIDQMYLGFRFALAEKIGEVPIILDEPFAYYDDERLENVLKVLSEKAKTSQIFILTCSDREQRILNKLGVKYKEVCL